MDKAAPLLDKEGIRGWLLQRITPDGTLATGGDSKHEVIAASILLRLAGWKIAATPATLATTVPAGRQPMAVPFVISVPPVADQDRKSTRVWSVMFVKVVAANVVFVVVPVLVARKITVDRHRS